jgi:hypothetical protein
VVFEKRESIGAIGGHCQKLKWIGRQKRIAPQARVGGGAVEEERMRMRRKLE